MDYLGHIISHEGVKVDPNKIKSINECKVPTAIKQLRGFLGLIWYYRKFFHNYGRIAAPLTTLLKRDEFSWTPEMNFHGLLKQLMAFNILKKQCS